MKLERIFKRDRNGAVVLDQSGVPVVRDDVPPYLRVDSESGVYWIDIYRKDKSPKRLCKSTKERDSLERAKITAEREVNRWMGENFVDHTALRMKFGQVCDEVMSQMRTAVKNKKLRPRTLEAAEIYIDRYLRDEFGHLYLDQIQARDWENFVVRFRALHPKKTLFDYFKAMSKLMRYADTNGIRKDEQGRLMPRFKISNPDPKTKAGRILPDADKDLLFKKANPDLRDQMIMAYTMGMRKLEHLKQSFDLTHCCHCDLAKKIVVVCEDHNKTGSKTKEGRVMAMSPQVYAMLLRRISSSDRQGSRWVFPSPEDPHKPVRTNQRAWKTAKKNAGIKGRFRYHDLRHMASTEMAKLVKEGHVSVVQVTRYLGMSISIFEKVYLHMNYEDTAPVSKLIAVKLPESDSSMEIRH